MTRLCNPWPERGPREFADPRPPRDEVHAIGAGDVAEARELMRSLSLSQAAQVLGVLASDLDLALWRTMGGRS